jgi:Uma2 family endonuclease
LTNMSTATQLMTFAEFEQLPDMPGKQELINGRLVSMPPPETKHSVVSKRVFRIFLLSLPEARVWHDHTGYRVAGGWLEPDVSVTWPDQPRDEKYILRAPMIAVEVLSPGEDLEEKVPLYFDEGALEVWILNSRKKTMTVYQLTAGVVNHFNVEGEYRCEPIGVTISLPELFADL